ncbi:hypothetical protein PCL_11279 [Purpureocillium lilacinum]|uniref:Uncharacterized protein n=1 Tax=Purpureocillium lilacinum TaxID=33203 RepID=A0A2U3DPX5_PURLI|nr:hypothetical protein PCL_11279 [Purpureocillium lilacinum]
MMPLAHIKTWPSVPTKAYRWLKSIPFLRASPPAKRCRFTGERRPTNFPPLFWDNLSNVSLTTRALRELDRRNEAQQHSPISSGSGEAVPKDKARFARHGGPDLRHLRGFPAPMASTQSSKTSRRTQSTEATSVGGRSSKSSAYNKNFQEHLIDHGVYLADQTDAEPRNLDSLHDQLLVPRTSLSPSTFSQPKFRDFQKKNNQVAFESDVMRTILPVLCGDHDDIPSQQNVLFTELEPITNNTAVKPKPDLFDGASLQDLHQDLRGDQRLRSTIILCDAQNDIRRRNDRKTSCTMITKHSARVTLPSSHHAMAKQHERLLHGVLSDVDDDHDPLDNLIPEKRRLARAMVGNLPPSCDEQVRYMQDVLFLLEDNWNPPRGRA